MELLVVVSAIAESLGESGARLGLEGGIVTTATRAVGERVLGFDDLLVGYRVGVLVGGQGEAFSF